MKTVKSVGLFFVMSLLIFAVGFLGGLQCAIRKGLDSSGQTLNLGMDFGMQPIGEGEQIVTAELERTKKSMGEEKQESRLPESSEMISAESGEEVIPFSGFLDTASLSNVLGADTEYVIEEMDILRGSIVETTLKLPEKYIGMDRETFLKAMDTYAAAPPLSELERGFVGLEVIGFSRQRVVVRMDYRYIQPGESFYLALVDHQVVVLLEDKKTIYIYTGISANMLSEELRNELMTQMIFIEDESSLYDFLESYSS